jgi:hypothetical protein
LRNILSSIRKNAPAKQIIVLLSAGAFILFYVRNERISEHPKNLKGFFDSRLGVIQVVDGVFSLYILSRMKLSVGVYRFLAGACIHHGLFA